MPSHTASKTPQPQTVPVLEGLPAFLSKRRFARECDTSTKTVDRRIADGTIRVVRLGRAVRVPRSELERLLKTAA